MKPSELIEWLLQGDVSIQYQTYRDLLNQEKTDLKKRIANEGWGQQFLSFQKPNGHWGEGFYQRKWISSHYTLLDLKHLNISNDIQQVKTPIQKILKENKSADGGINPARSIPDSDVCVNGMFLNYACYFETNEEELKSIIDFILTQQLTDGGFNCNFNQRWRAKHSSLHSTLSVIEGIREYDVYGYTYRLDELKKVELESREFILQHKLYKSDKTGEVIDKKMTMLSYPSRWRYDILRALEYFCYAGVKFDPRMNDALEQVKSKQRKDKKWPVQQKYAGMVHFDMEKSGEASRWNTLRALKVLNYYMN